MSNMRDIRQEHPRRIEQGGSVALWTLSGLALAACGGGGVTGSTWGIRSQGFNYPMPNLQYAPAPAGQVSVTAPAAAFRYDGDTMGQTQSVSRALDLGTYNFVLVPDPDDPGNGNFLIEYKPLTETIPDGARIIGTITIGATPAASNFTPNKFTPPSTRLDGTDGNDIIPPSIDPEFIRGGNGRDSALGYGANHYAHGYGSDFYPLGTEGFITGSQAGVSQTIWYRFTSSETDFRGDDGSDRIQGFERGVDRLIFVDMDEDTPISDFAEFIAAFGDYHIDGSTGANMAIEILFDLDNGPEKVIRVGDYRINTYEKQSIEGIQIYFNTFFNEDGSEEVEYRKIHGGFNYRIGEGSIRIDFNTHIPMDSLLTAADDFTTVTEEGAKYFGENGAGIFAEYTAYRAKSVSGVLINNSNALLTDFSLLPHYFGGEDNFVVMSEAEALAAGVEFL